MQFFLYEILARVVAVYLCVDCSRKLWHGYFERKIGFRNADLMDWSTWVAHRDTTPARYWIQMGIQAVFLVACLFVAIFGWWHPDR